MIYLASPFTHTDKQVEFHRFTEVLKVVHYLVEKSEMVFSPILHCYPIHVFLGAPGDFHYWSVWNKSMLERCDRLWVLGLKGWMDSKGVDSEILLARSLHKPISIIDPKYYTVVPYAL